jgi:hypothetical protein
LGADLVVLTAATHCEHADWSADELVDPERIPDAYA